MTFDICVFELQVLLAGKDDGSVATLLPASEEETECLCIEWNISSNCHRQTETGGTNKTCFNPQKPSIRQI